MSVMKPYVMTLSILLILVHKTPGGLFKSYHAKSQEPWNPCELYHGRCRDTCKEHEIQYLTCPNHQRCCLELPGKSTSSNNVREDPNSNLVEVEDRTKPAPRSAVTVSSTVVPALYVTSPD
ncbi:beta-defensin 121 [Rhynchonycteris naso]